MKEDELLIVKGNARRDHFTGGIRFTAEAVMDIELARSRFGYALRVVLDHTVNVKKLRSTLQPYCVCGTDNKNAGLLVSVHYCGTGFEGDLILGEAWRVRPSDDLLVALNAPSIGEKGQGEVQY